MLEEYKAKTNIGVALGVVLQIAGSSLYHDGSPSLGYLLLIAGCLIFIWGCAQYAKGKGHTHWLGLLGLLSLAGLIILFILEDHTKGNNVIQNPD